MNKLNIGHTELFVREDGIIEVIASNHIYTADDIKAIHKAIAQIKKNEKELILLHAENFTTIDQDARKYLSTPEAGANSLAEAYIIRTLAQRILMNFLIKVSGTPVPVKFFTDTQEAVKWLRSTNG
jgi:hypothetical protein